MIRHRSELASRFLGKTNMDTKRLLQELGVDLSKHAGSDLACRSPIDGAQIAVLRVDSAAEVQAKVGAAAEAFRAWREVPAPRRGELVRLFGEELRAQKAALGKLVSIEAGKILQEGHGEVQEMVDMCDFAVGRSEEHTSELQSPCNLVCRLLREKRKEN